jgi:hypothetical protein
MNLDNYIVESSILYGGFLAFSIGYFIYLFEKKDKDL